MGFLDMVFGSSLSAEKTREILEKAGKNVKAATNARASLRRVIADANGIGTNTEGRTVNAVLKEIKLCGSLPAGVEPAVWWDGANKEARMELLARVADYLKP